MLVSLTRSAGSPRLAALALLCGTQVACCCSPPAPALGDRGAPRAVNRAAAAETPPGASPDSVTRIAMRNVDFHIDGDIVLRIRRLDGEMLSRTPGAPVLFDDKTAFTLALDTAEVGLTGEDLGRLMNGYVFAYPGAPLRNLSVRVAGNEIVQTGIMHKGVDIPFEITASVTLTPDGLIRLRPRKVRICGIDGGGLLKALNLTLASLLDLSKSHGARVERNDIILNPDSILPPPRISGRIVDVRIEGQQVVQRFGRSRPGTESGAPETRAPLVPSDPSALNYIFFRGGTLRFGKLYMVHADMQIVDASPSDPFDFSMDGYEKQLVAGYSRNTPSQGLQVFMPDYRQVRGSASVRLPAAVRAPSP